MKNKILPCAAAFTLLFSCANSPAARTKPVKAGPFYSVSRAETVPAFDDSSSESSLDLSFFLFDTDKPGLSELVRAYLYAGRPAEEYLSDVMDDLRTTYRMTLEENSDWGIDQSWYYGEEQDIIIKGSFALVSVNAESYMGGAHGSHSVDYYLFDIETPSRLAVNDIITEENMPRFYALAERELRRFSEQASDTPLPARLPLSAGIYFDDEFEAEDFYPAKDGLHLQWDPYQLAAYVFGSIDITLDWKELSDLLSPEGTKLAAAFSR